MEVGFIGLGNIGGPCAKHLLDAGHRVTVFDVREDAVERFARLGARTARSPAGVAEEAAGVFLSLPTPAAAPEVVAGAGGLLDSARPGPVLVDLSTNSVGTARALFEQCRQAEVDYLDCPVSGGAWAAERGDLALMPSGDESAFDRVRDTLVCFGKDDTQWLGPSGTGTLMKLINNQVFLVATQVFGEGYLMAAKAGLDVSLFLATLRGSSAGMYMPLADMIVKRQWESSSYDLSLAEKDLRLALESAAEIGTPMPLTEAAHGVLARSVEAGLGGKFFIGAMETLEADAGFTAAVPPAMEAQ